MAITKLLPTQWKAAFNHISVHDKANMYTDVSSSTYSIIKLTGLSIFDVEDFYLGGFEKNKIPAGSEVTGYAVRIKIANLHGKVSTAGISMYHGVGGSIDGGAIIPGTTLTNVEPGTLTLPTDGVDWDVINSLVQSGNLYIHIPIETLANNDGGIGVYGAEIEVTYTPPKKYVTGRRLQRFWDNAKNYIDTEIPTNVSDLTNDAGYLTSHQDISGKADKSEIPTKVSDLQNDAGYLTQHQSLADYALKSEIPTVTNDFTDDYKDKVDSLWEDYQDAITALG